MEERLEIQTTRFEETFGEVDHAEVDSISVDQLRTLFTQLAEFPYLKSVLTPLLRHVVARGLQDDIAYFVPQTEVLGLSEDKCLSEWIPEEILRSPGLIDYPPAILSWTRIWSHFQDVTPTDLENHNLTTTGGIFAAYYHMLEMATRDVSTELILFECTFTDYGTVDCFRWRNVVGWLGLDNEFRVVDVGDVRCEGSWLIVPVGGEGLEVSLAVGLLDLRRIQTSIVGENPLFKFLSAEVIVWY